MPDEKSRVSSLFLALILPAFLVLYVLAACGALMLADRFGVGWIEPVAFFMLMSLAFLFLPLLPLLESMHLMAGEYYRLPTPLGVALATTLVALAVFVIGFALASWLRAR